MNTPIQEISLDGFIQEYVEIQRDDKARRFCFVLGAGASVASGIPLAKDLARDWLNKMYDRSTQKNRYTFGDWMEQRLHGVEDLDPNDLGAMYSKVYVACFPSFSKQGRRYLERLMEDGRPSYGK